MGEKVITSDEAERVQSVPYPYDHRRGYMYNVIVSKAN